MAANERMWPGLRVKADATLLDTVEDAVCVALDDGALLGMARQTWHETHPDTPDTTLDIYLSKTADTAGCIETVSATLKEFLGAKSEAVVIEPASTPQQDWATQWREWFRPVRVSGTLAILPAWRNDNEALGEINLPPETRVIRIDPGQAFGSGTHPTTRLTLRMLEAESPHRLLDYGAGSGILSFLAVMQNAERVVSVEVDPESVENFETNRDLNGCDPARIDHRIGTSDCLSNNETFDTIVCNVLFDRVRNDLARLAAALEPGGIFLYSGFLADDLDTTRGFFTDTLHLRVTDEDREEEWAALRVVK